MPELDGSAVLSVYEDGDGAIWIATGGKGLKRYDQGKFTTYTTRPLKQMTRPYWVRQPNETDLRIDLITGGSICLRGADNYDSLRGEGLDFLILDEYAAMDPAAWKEDSGRLWPTVEAALCSSALPAATIISSTSTKRCKASRTGNRLSAPAQFK